MLRRNSVSSSSQPEEVETSIKATSPPASKSKPNFLNSSMAQPRDIGYETLPSSIVPGFPLAASQSSSVKLGIRDGDDMNGDVTNNRHIEENAAQENFVVKHGQSQKKLDGERLSKNRSRDAFVPSSTVNRGATISAQKGQRSMKKQALPAVRISNVQTRSAFKSGGKVSGSASQASLSRSLQSCETSVNGEGVTTTRSGRQSFKIRI